MYRGHQFQMRENVYFFKNNLCIVMIEGEKIFVSPSFEGRKHGGDWGYLLRDSNFNYPSNILTHSVIGRDNRIRVTNTTLYPYRAIVHLVIQFNGQEVYGCTGALISKDTVFTAGHCVYNKSLVDGQKCYCDSW